MKKYYGILFLLLLLHLVFLINLQFIAWPEMLSYAYLRNHGFLIYKDMIHPYPPILTMVLSWIYFVWGYKLWVLQAFTWSIILAIDILIFLLISQISKNGLVALGGVGMYVSLQPFLEGNMLWFDLAIVPPVLLGLFFIILNDQKKSRSKLNLFVSGLFFTIAGFVKQTAGIVYLVAVFYLLLKKVSFNQLKYFLLGPLLIGIPLLVRLVQEGALQDFIHWVIIYPATMWKNFSGYVQMSINGYQAIVLIIFVCIPLLIILLQPKLWKERYLQLLIPLLLGSLIMVYPRISFFHTQLLLALSVITWVFLLSSSSQKLLGGVLLIGGLFLIFLTNHRVVLLHEWQKEARFYAKSDMELADKIKSKTYNNERIYLQGLHSGLYVLADRLPPKRWTDNFGWYLEITGVQEEITYRWQQNPPSKVLWRIPNQGNWYDLGVYQPKKIAQWIEDNYTRKVEIEPGVWLWEKK